MYFFNKLFLKEVNIWIFWNNKRLPENFFEKFELIMFIIFTQCL